MELTVQIISMLAMAAVFLVALAGVILPALPGPAIAAAGVLVYRLVFPEGAITWNFVIVSALAAAFAQIADFFFSWLGAKRYGASWGGVLGSFLGLIVGIILSPTIIMIFVAPIVGAVLGELLTGKDFNGSLKAGWGTFLGSMFSTAVKFAIILSMAFAFYAIVLTR